MLAVSKMFWRATVRVAEQSYKFSRPIIYLLRLSGLFPLKIEREKSGKLYMQWSPLYAAYSYFVELFLHVTMSLGWAVDISRAGVDSVRIHSSTELFIGVVDMICLQIAMFFMITVIPAKFLQFFAYVECVNDVDKILETKHTLGDAVQQWIVCFVWWLIVVAIHYLTYMTYVVTLRDRLSAWWILELFLWHYIICLVVMFGEYQYFYLGNSLSKRLTRLNKILQTFCVLGNKEVVENRLFLHHTGKVIGKIEFNVEYPGKRIAALMQTYLKLVDAAEHQNTLLGETAVVVIGLAFWHLVLCMYFLCFEMTKVHPHPVTISVFTALILFHAARLLMITESWHTCCLEVEATKKWVCQLQCSAVGRRIRKELLTFQIILCLRTIEFSLAGFYSIDRTLVTSLLGATTTYVLVLLNYRPQVTE